MNSEIETYSRIAKKLKKDYTKLSDFEILTLAVQIERNQLLENALCINRANNHLGSIEAIAISLGFSQKSYEETITDVLKAI